MQSKACRDCLTVYPVQDFPRYSNGRGSRPICRACLNAKGAKAKRDKRANDPEFYKTELERNKSYRDKYSEGYATHRLKKRAKFKSAYFNDVAFRCKQLCGSMKSRAIKKGLSFNITPELVHALIAVQNNKCAVTKTPFDFSASEKYARNPLAPSIDRKDNNKGYTFDNIQVVCAWFNLLKNEWSDEDTKSFIFVAYHSLFKGSDN